MFKKLKWQIYIVVLPLVVVPSILLGTLFLNYLKEYEVRKITSALELSAKRVAEEIESNLEVKQASLHLISTDPILSRYAKVADLNLRYRIYLEGLLTRFNNYLDHTKGYQQILFVNPDKTLDAFQSKTDVTFDYRPFLNKISRDNLIAQSRLAHLIKSAGGNYHYALFLPVWIDQSASNPASASSFHGHIGIISDLLWLEKKLVNETGDNLITFIIKNNNTPFLGSQKGALLATQELDSSLYSKDLSYRISLPESGLEIEAYMPHWHIQESVGVLNLATISIVIVSVIITSILLLFFINTRILLPIQKLNFVTKQIEKGKYKIPTEVSSSSEFLQLNRSINDMYKALKSVLNTVKEAVITLDINGQIKQVNPPAIEMFGFEYDEFIGQSLAQLLESDEPFVDGVEAKDYVARNPNISYMAKRRNGTIFPVRISVTDSGNQEHVVTFLNLSELENNESFLHAVVDNIPLMVFVKEAKNLTFTHFNKAGETFLGVTKEEMIGKSDYDFFPEEQARFFVETDRKVLRETEPFIVEQEPIETPNGTRILFTTKISIRNSNGEPAFLLGISEDITEKLKLQKEIEFLAVHDPMTGLLNRAALNRYLETEIKRCERNHKSLACLFFDLNDFKPINDKYGHKVGDEVLIEVARRIQREVREVDCAARIGGDEFIVILTELDSAEAVDASINRFMQIISEPMSIGENEFSLSVSVGRALYPQDAQSIDELISKADDKMYEHKKASK